MKSNQLFTTACITCPDKSGQAIHADVGYNVSEILMKQ